MNRLAGVTLLRSTVWDRKYSIGADTPLRDVIVLIFILSPPCTIGYIHFVAEIRKVFLLVDICGRTAKCEQKPSLAEIYRFRNNAAQYASHF